VGYALRLVLLEHPLAITVPSMHISANNGGSHSQLVLQIDLILEANVTSKF